MFGASIQLLRVSGIPLRVDASWVLVAVLVAWTLATQVFPQAQPELGPGTYWVMGVLGTLGLFTSVVLHELAHALVARREGIRMSGITLFIFGGVAEMRDEPASAGAEFRVAVAGPIASILIAGLCAGAQHAVPWPDAAGGILDYLAWVNGLLVAFNLIPAFPLDGGRILRSALWHWKADLYWATGIAAQIGSGFGVSLMLLGLLAILAGRFVSGMWWVLIGMFLRSAAQNSWRQVLARRALAHQPVRRFMRTDPRTVSPEVPLADLVEDYIYRYHHRIFPVVEDDHLLGCVSARQVRQVPREEWAARTVADILQPCSAANTVGPDEDAISALAKMTRSNISRLMVTEHDRLVGILTLKDLLRYIALRLELEGQGLSPGRGP